MPKEVREEWYEGCGPGHLGDWFVPDTIWGLSITEPCRIHDHEYEVGETERDKRRADAHMLRNCTVVIYNKTTNKLIRKARMRRAFIYYKMVHKFGHAAFWKGKEHGVQSK